MAAADAGFLKLGMSMSAARFLLEPRHAQVGQHEIRDPRRELDQRLLAVLRDRHIVPGLGQVHPQSRPHCALVIDDQDPGFALEGRHGETDATGC